MEFDHHGVATIPIILILAMMGCFASLSQAYTFYVGGRDGWVLNPKEQYNQWAERMRFQVNDTLIFKYKKGYDTVLQVNQDDYFNCYKEKPLQALKDGESVFKFDQPGPFFFISGHADNCAKGQRLIIVVLHPRNPPPAPVQAPAPAPAMVNPPAPAVLNPPAPVSVPVPIPAPVAVVNNPPPPAPAAPAVTPVPSQGLVQHNLAPAPAPETSGAAINSGGFVLGFGICFMGMVALSV